MAQTLRARKDDDMLLEQSEADAAAGFCGLCTPPFTHRQLQAEKTMNKQITKMWELLLQRPHRLIPGCVITQSSGKKRIIDNADTLWAV